MMGRSIIFFRVGRVLYSISETIFSMHALMRTLLNHPYDITSCLCTCTVVFLQPA
jgi:hypothetical protein